MLRKKNLLLVLSLAVFLLTGCMFPASEQEKNQVPNEDQLLTVQNAVEKYQEKSGGLLPIQTKESDIDIYEKYLIDFSLLKNENLLSETPGNAYESGGIYQYTLVNVEEKPEVKLIDLRLTDQIRKVNVKLDLYRSKNLYPPFGKKIEDDLYQVNYEKIGFKSEPVIKSPYSNENLSLVMNSDGDLFIDYRSDILKIIKEESPELEEDIDLRSLYYIYSPFVPAYSLPYKLVDKEPEFDL